MARSFANISVYHNLFRASCTCNLCKQKLIVGQGIDCCLLTDVSMVIIVGSSLLHLLLYFQVISPGPKAFSAGLTELKEVYLIATKVLILLT